MFFTNPVVLSVFLMIALCLLKVNVILAILVSALVAGLTAGMGLEKTMDVLVDGMGGNSETALSYILLGGLAVAVNQSGLAHLLAGKISQVVRSRRGVFLLGMVVIAALSQNLIPVHIAFIPILIPPLLEVMNKMKIDRRGVACALTFGLKTPYLTLPVGFGLIFHNLIKDQMVANGLPVELGMVWKSMWIPGIGMLVGLLVALFISYRKPREYQQIAIENSGEVALKFTKKHWFALLAALSAFVVQLLTGSLPLGAIVALSLMVATGIIQWRRMDDVVDGGIGLMGFIAFVMLVAAGYAQVLRETGAVTELVQLVVSWVGTSKVAAALLMLCVGLLVTMGIGTSFGTIPILAAIYCPLSQELGLSVMATICLVGVAGALGDAGSPASDSTLGPTAGLNVDHQHNHIYDTCVPTFLHYNIPLILFGVLGALIL